MGLLLSLLRASHALPATAPEPYPPIGPILYFDGRCVVAVHLVLKRPGGAERTDVPGDWFGPHELDLLSYAYRERPPFSSTPVDLPTELQEVTCSFPSSAEYEHDGDAGTSRAATDTTASAPLSTIHRFALSAYLTSFRQGTAAVLHLIFVKPTVDELYGDSPITEVQLIQLANVWEGGAGTPGRLAVEGETGPVWLASTGQAPRFKFSLTGAIATDRTVAEIFNSVLEALPRETPEGTTAVPWRPGERPGESCVPYLNGTIQIECPGTIGSLAKNLSQLRSEDPTHPMPALGNSERMELLALSGLLRAMPNYTDTADHELPSIFKEVVLEPRMLTVVHKGTFLRLADEMRMPSPYFLLPNALALHNEECLRRADAAISSASTRLRSGKRGFLHSPARMLEVNRIRHEVADILDTEVVPNVIQYPNLRRLFDTAQESRGLTSLDQTTRQRMDTLTTDIETQARDGQSLASAIITVVLLVATGALVKTSGAFFWVIVGVGVVYLGWLFGVADWWPAWHADEAYVRTLRRRRRPGRES